METAANPPNQATESLASQVRRAVIWRSGSQILGQAIAWASTFLVIRILNPQDYGLFAMTQVVLALLNMLNGYGLASGLIQRAEVTQREIRQLFGMLLLLNAALACAQLLLAPVAAAYYRQPIVADLLRVQALLYIATPFIALPYALLSRSMEFHRQAQVNIVAAVTGAVAALGGAWGGLGVWTLVLAPMVLFSTRAIGMTIAAKSLMWPLFDFRGAGDIARFGGVMAAGQLFWFLQSQADVFIAGRLLGAHDIGIYTTSLFLTQILVSKFVPPLNEVAFSAYARMQHDRDGLARAFARAARLIMMVAMPFYLGLAVVAEPMVAVVLGAKWAQTAPIIHLMAFAMPFMTLHTLFAPAAEACGRPGISARNAAFGTLLLPAAFVIGVQWGLIGMAAAWLCAYPLILMLSARQSLPVIGLSARDLAGSIAPPVLAAIGMAAVVALVDSLLPPMLSFVRLAMLVGLGAAVYAGWLMLFARDAVTDAIAMIRNR